MSLDLLLGYSILLLGYYMTPIINFCSMGIICHEIPFLRCRATMDGHCMPPGSIVRQLDSRGQMLRHSNE
jgi:hypothetical protein